MQEFRASMNILNGKLELLTEERRKKKIKKDKSERIKERQRKCRKKAPF